VLAQAPQLPGGATSLNETYQDWTVGCRVVNDTRSCTITQQQQRQDGQRVLAIELRKQADQAVPGLLVLPFGLSLQGG
ncbi:invasion associated locus B family protein, partial [Escherichia coli]